MRLPREALQAADRASALSPTDTQTLNTLGIVYTQANAHERAMSLSQGAGALRPARASHRFNRATLLTFAGDRDGAEREYGEGLRLDPAQWKAHLARSQLRRQTASANHVESLRTLLSTAGGNAEARLYLNLALAKEYEDLGRYPLAFEHLGAGKSSHRDSRRHAFARDQALFDALMHATPVPAAGAVGNDSDEPIFVIGMPRSGTTLVDRILSSHPQVHSAGELQNFGVAFRSEEHTSELQSLM